MMPSVKPHRLPFIDILRGVAVIAMIIYHTSWDLGFFGFITPITGQLLWQNIARLIAASFLFLSGVSLVLAHQKGFRHQGFLKRLGLLSAAAGLVSLTTWFLFPDSPILFGILHCLAFSSVLALPFLRLPLWAVVVAAVGAALVPIYIQYEFFNRSWLVWTGLNSVVPAANDYVPLLPWFSIVLTGLAVAKIGQSYHVFDKFASWQPPKNMRPLVWMGQKSLPIYLLHQPLIFGLVYATAMLLAPQVQHKSDEFTTSCYASCETSGGTRDRCIRFCACTKIRLQDNNLWTKALSGSFTPRDGEQMSQISKECANQ